MSNQATAFVAECWGALKRDPLGTLNRWQDQRAIWLVGGLVALAMELIAYFYFQTFLAMAPCELCVYIRFSMTVIFLGGMLVAIAPKNAILRAIGFIVIGYGVFKGWEWCIRLEMTHHMMQALEAGGDLFAAGGGAGACSTEPSFPFGLPLHVWFPSTFMPTGLCGEDSWRFLSLNMAEWLMIVYAVYTVLLAAMLLAWGLKGRSTGRPAAQN